MLSINHIYCVPVARDVSKLFQVLLLHYTIIIVILIYPLKTFCSRFRKGFTRTIDIRVYAHIRQTLKGAFLFARLKSVSATNFVCYGTYNRFT